MAIIKQTIRWKKDEKVTGLARVTAGERMWSLVLKIETDAGIKDQFTLLYIFSTTGSYGGPYKFRICHPITNKWMVSSEQWPTQEEAKLGADAWVKLHRKTPSSIMSLVIAKGLKVHEPVKENESGKE